MPGGRLVVSSNGNKPGTGVVWSMHPAQGNANATVVHRTLVACDVAKPINGTQMKQTFYNDANGANSMGDFARHSTPVIANGTVHLGTFSNKVVHFVL